MSLSEIEVHCEEINLERIVRITKNHLNDIGYKAKEIAQSENVYTLRVQKGVSRWDVAFDQKLQRTGNFVSMTIARLEPRLKTPTLQRKKQDNRPQNTSVWGLFWRWRIYAYIAAFIGAIVLSFFQGSSFTYVGYGLLGVVGAILLVYIAQYVLRSYRTPKEIKGVEQLGRDLRGIVQQITKEGDMQAIYCWQCFEEVPKHSTSCSNCGANITKL